MRDDTRVYPQVVIKAPDLYSDRYRKGDTYFIYAYLDSAGTVIYVGRSAALRRRNSHHYHGSEWYSQVAEMRILFETTNRGEAKAAEARAIRELTPTYNIQHNPRAAA